MKNKNINILKAPKYKMKEVPIETLIRLVQDLRGKDLKAMYIKICGEDAILKLKNNGPMLRQRICYILQKQRYGGLSAKHYNMIYRLTANGGTTPVKNKFHPKADTILTRIWQGAEHRVYVRHHGFEYNKKVYKSLSSVAKNITGHERSGPAFFGLKTKLGGAS